MKKNPIILVGMQTFVLTFLFAIPAQASINIGAPLSSSGSVITIHSAATPYWTPVQSGAATPVPVSTTSPVYVPVPTPVSVSPSTPVTVSASAPAPVAIPVAPSSSGGNNVIAISSGQAGASGSSVVSLKNILSTPSTSPAASTSPAKSSSSASNQPSSSIPGAPSIPPATSLTADEQSMVDMVNQERAAAGLKPLKVDLRLVAVARAKANDMAANNYFGHTSPTFGSPWAMMEDVGLNVQWAGENIAGNVSASGAMAAWEASPAHLANILDPKFTAIGVGEAPGSSYNIYVQEFLQE